MSPQTKPPTIAPSARVRWVASILGVAQCGAITLAFAQPIGLPSTFGQVHDLLQPYFRLTRFGPDGAKVQVADGEIDERSLSLQVAITQDPGEADWFDLSWPVYAGMADSDRRHRFLRMISTLSEGERFGLIAQWLTPVVESYESDRDVLAIRLIRRPSLLSSVTEDEFSTVYEASVAYQPDGRLTFVHRQPDRLTSLATDPRAESARP